MCYETGKRIYFLNNDLSETLGQTLTPEITYFSFAAGGQAVFYDKNHTMMYLVDILNRHIVILTDKKDIELFKVPNMTDNTEMHSCGLSLKKVHLERFFQKKYIENRHKYFLDFMTQ